MLSDQYYIICIEQTEIKEKTKMANSIKRHKGLFYKVVWSEDDNGFYAEIFNREGEQLHITELSLLGLDADGFAKTWIEAQS